MMHYEDNISEVTDANYSVYYKCGEDGSWSDKQLHWHEELEIICYVSGESRMICGRESFVPEPRGIYIVNPYECFILMCLLTDCPLAVFSEIWEMSYEAEEL